MKALVLLLCLSSATFLFAKDKPARNYQDGTLIATHRIRSGNSCSSNTSTNGNIDAQTDASGNTSGSVAANSNTSTNCTDVYRYQYTVRSGNVNYVLSPAMTGGKEATTLLTFGFGAMFMKHSALANRLPGTSVKLATDGKHFYVLVDKQESPFNLISSEELPTGNPLSLKASPGEQQ
jgi:hypothetical protein